MIVKNDDAKWFKAKMKEFKNDPEFLKEKIALLNDEVKALRRDKKYLMGIINRTRKALNDDQK